jgi:prevent-host-death family protein
MKTIATHEAKTHLSRFLKEVSGGETIVIARGRKPLAKLVPYTDPAASIRPKVGQTLDAPMSIPDEAFAPLGNDEMKEWGL